MAVPLYEPSPRWGSVSSAGNNEHYIYGGYVKNFMKWKKELSTTVEVYDVFLETWRSVPTSGAPSPGLYVCGTAYSDHLLYTYGGLDGTSETATGSLHQLDTRSYTWTELAPPSTDGPMKKHGCAMVHHNHSLVVSGGYGLLTGYTLQPESLFNERTNGKGWTNEVHQFDILKGEGSDVSVAT